jgi:hypothetical protein
MQNDAHYKFFDEIKRPKIFIVRDILKGGIGEIINEFTGEPEIITEDEDYIQFGEYTIAGFPFAKNYFSFLQSLANNLILEVKANKYDKKSDYNAYLLDIERDIDKLLQNVFEDSQGWQRYKHLSEIVHVNFMNVDHHLNLAEISPDHILLSWVHEFSDRMSAIIHDIQEKLTVGYPDLSSDSTDKRIACRASAEEIRNYFYRLDRQNNDGEQILTREEIDRFLQANFQCFEINTEKQILKPKLSGDDIKYFIFIFIKNYDQGGNRLTYEQLCKENFVQFENTTIDTIRSNFRGTKPKKYFLG